VPSVALVTSSFLPRVGGVEEHVRRLAVALRDRGHRVAVWAVDRGDLPATLPGVAVRYLPAPLPSASPRGVLRFAAVAPAALRAWREALAADAPDLLHVQCFGPNGPWATALARATGIPLVVGTHGETFADDGGLFHRSWVQRTALRSALHRAAGVTTASRFTADDLARFGWRGPTDVVGNGVDLDERAGPRPAWLPHRYVLGLGRLVPVKGFDLLVRAFAQARTEGTVDERVHLLLAGDGPERSALRDLAASLGVGDVVHLPGALDRPEVTAVAAGARALVAPSRLEAFGIAALEAMRAGVPVVVSRSGGAGEVVTDGVDGLVVDPTVPAVSEALARLSDRSLRERLGAAGRATPAAGHGRRWPTGSSTCTRESSPGRRPARPRSNEPAAGPRHHPG